MSYPIHDLYYYGYNALTLAVPSQVPLSTIGITANLIKAELCNYIGDCHDSTFSWKVREVFAVFDSSTTSNYQRSPVGFCGFPSAVMESNLTDLG